MADYHTHAEVDYIVDEVYKKAPQIYDLVSSVDKMVNDKYKSLPDFSKNKIIGYMDHRLCIFIKHNYNLDNITFWDILHKIKQIKDTPEDASDDHKNRMKELF